MAWLASVLVSPHVGKKDHWKVKASNLVRSVPGFDPDPEDLLGAPEPAHDPAPEIPGEVKNVKHQNLEGLNALFDRIDAARRGPNG